MGNHLYYGWYWYFLSHNAGKKDIIVPGVYLEPVHSKYIIFKGTYNDHKVLQIAYFVHHDAQIFSQLLSLP
jgi:hypothetical protein